MRASGYSSEDFEVNTIELEDSELSFLNICESEENQYSWPAKQYDFQNINSNERSLFPSQVSASPRIADASTCDELNSKLQLNNLRCQSSSQLKPSRFQSFKFQESRIKESLSTNHVNIFNKGGIFNSHEVDNSNARLPNNLNHRICSDSSVATSYAAQSQYYAFIPASYSTPQISNGLIYNYSLPVQVPSPGFSLVNNNNYYFPSYQIGYTPLLLLGNLNDACHNLKKYSNQSNQDDDPLFQLNKDILSKKGHKVLRKHANINDSIKHQLSVSDILEKDNISEYINSLKGSKKVQKIIAPLEDQHPDILLLFESIFPSLGKITNHNFGNYLCKLLLKKVGFNERQQAWKFYKRRNLLDYALHQFGTHSIQSLIQSASSLKEEIFVIGQLEDYFDILAFHHNGAHILVNILASYDEKSVVNLISYLNNNFAQLSNHCIGSTLAKKLINIMATYKPNVKSDFLKQFYKQIPALFNDKYGCSVIIDIIDSWGRPGSSIIVETLEPNLSYYIKGKYSINVLLKCLDAIPKVSRFIN